MRKLLWVGLAAVLCAAHAGPADAIVLRYRPKVGEVTKYKAEMSGRTHIATGGVEQAEPAQVTSLLRYQERVLRETEELTRVEIELTGGAVTAKVAGTTQSSELPTGRVVVDRDRQSRLAAVVDAEGFGPGVDALGLGPDAWSKLSALGTLPSGNVEVGDSWTEEVKVPVSAGLPETTIKATSKLLSLTTLQGRRCAKIRTSLRGAMKLDSAQLAGAVQALEATFEGDLVWHYDYERSVPVHSEGTVTTVVTVPPREPELPGGVKATTRLQVKVTVES